LLNNDESSINFSDIQVIFYIEQIEKQEITVQVEGENLAYYGAFIDSVEIPEGLETDTSFLTIDGTDTNDAYRQNIREKTITLNFNIDACDLETSTLLLRQITKLLVNDKDEYNRPIPKIIEFSHYPDSYYEYIIEEALDIETEVTSYNVTAKLTIPAGTSYSQENTVTNTIGYVQGLAAINPIITLQPNDTVIQITETLTGQTFNIGYTGDWNDKVVEIDCEDRKVWLLSDEEADDGIEISKYVDMNSDWFRLHGEYQFEATNATIRTITYNERW
jgi:phage-related protein